MQVDEDISNTSNNRPFSDVLAKQMNRRTMLAGSVEVAAAGFLASTFGPQVLAGDGQKLIDFTPLSVANGGGAIPGISADYEYSVILRWGDPLQPGGPQFQYPPAPQDQTLQVGIGHDGMWFFPLPDPDQPRCGWNNDFGNHPWHSADFVRGRGNERGVLCLNHEYGMNNHVLGKPAPQNLDDVRVSQHAHGVSVIEIARQAKHPRWQFWRRESEWQLVASRLSRRIHVNTPVAFSGPAHDHTLLRTAIGNEPKGTLNNCSNGCTPWGTYLTCEENIHFYFGASDESFTANATQARYGFAKRWGSFHGWYLFDKRFDMSDPDYQNEENRFGWVVEIDPMDPTSTPIKRTALGRCKHEGAAMGIDESGRVVVYMGDDEQFEYIYKFVSQDDWRRMRAEGKSPLDHGTLYVARFNEDNTGDWLELSLNHPTLAARFADMGELLVNTRIAADMVGATPMDRPEWTTVAPDGQVYCTLTNNSRRAEVNAANPMAPNPDGHIIRWREREGHSGTAFTWDIFLIARDSHGEDDESTFSSPDGLWADPDGRLFFMTDGIQKKDLNDQLLVVDTNSGEVKRLFSGVPGCEVTGITVTPDRRTMFVNVQHPGNGDPQRTNFPVMNEVPDGVTVPRDAMIVITKKDGGVIGS